MLMMKFHLCSLTIACLLGSATSLAQTNSTTAPSAQSAATTPSDDQAELVKELSNPVASLISVPFQNNFDFGLGPNDDGFRYTLNFQPVLPFVLNKDWNLISRTVLPIVHQSDVIGTTSQTGLSDTVQSFFFVPNKAAPFVWGAGPVLLVDTATNDLLGTQKFGIGPTVVAVKQQGPWTAGALFNHLWSVAGARNRADVSTTLLQPFLSYATKSLWTFTLQTESTHDWTASQWSVPVLVIASKLMTFGTQPVSMGGGIRCWATSPAGGPKDCGFRLLVTPLFPKK